MSGLDGAILFLDIDGAVCPYERDWRRSGVYSLSDQYDYDIITNLRVPLASHVRQLLLDVPTRKAVWSSSWGDVSNAVNDALGIEHFTVMMDTDSKLRDGKRYSMNSFLENNPGVSHVILVEDEPYEVMHDNVTVITTEEFVGLTVDQTENIRKLLGL